MSKEEQLQRCRDFIQSIAYLGYNGSHYQNKETQDLEDRISNWAYKEYKEIFGKDAP